MQILFNFIQFDLILCNLIKFCFYVECSRSEGDESFYSKLTQSLGDVKEKVSNTKKIENTHTQK